MSRPPDLQEWELCFLPKGRIKEHPARYGKISRQENSSFDFQYRPNFEDGSLHKKALFTAFRPAEAVDKRRRVLFLRAVCFFQQ